MDPDLNSRLARLQRLQPQLQADMDALSLNAQQRVDEPSKSLTSSVKAKQVEVAALPGPVTPVVQAGAVVESSAMAAVMKPDSGTHLRTPMV